MSGTENNSTVYEAKDVPPDARLPTAHGEFRIRIFREDGKNLDHVALANKRLLVDRRALIRAPELNQVVDVGTHLLARFLGGTLAFRPDDYALRVDVVDGTASTRHHDRTRIARRNELHPGTHEWSPSDVPPMPARSAQTSQK